MGQTARKNLPLMVPLTCDSAAPRGRSICIGPGDLVSYIIMYAIIEAGGKQYWVTQGETVRVDKLEAAQGQEVTFKALWAVGDAAEGQEPAVARQAKVEAVVVGEMRGPKIVVFKKRTKKAYQKTQGHRQNLTQVQIKTISLN